MLLGNEFRGVDEQAVVTLADVVCLEIQAVLVALCAAQVGDEPTVG